MAAKHELIAPDGDRVLIKRDEEGRISRGDDLGESLTKPVRKRVKKTVKSGQDVKPEHGDRGRRH